MDETDISLIVPLYIEYYNKNENGIWNENTVYKRIHQVWSREDSYCLIMQENKKTVAFAMGYFEQYDDCQTYDLIEIVVAAQYQHKGIGTIFMEELETRVKEMGAMSIQLQAVNDEQHEHFYGKLHYKDVTNFVLKCKFL
jgi:GNAT superfamily N-acetyltransferase